MINITVNIPPNLASDIQNQLNDYVQRSLNVVSDYMPGRVAEIFDTEGTRDGDGDPWIPTTSVARSNRKSGNYDAPTLTDTGALRQSIQGEVQQFPSGFILVLSSDRSYAQLMQEGGTIEIDSNTYTVPPRPFLFFTSSDDRLIDEIFEDEQL